METLFQTLFQLAKDPAGEPQEIQVDNTWTDLSVRLRDHCPELVGPFDDFFAHAYTLYKGEQRWQFLAGVHCGLVLAAQARR